MKTKSLLTVCSLILITFIIGVSCSKEPDSSNVNSRTLSLDDNYFYEGTSASVGTLGRVLFYDKSLSLNNAISCGSCHLQSRAFADDGQFSTGFENVKTSRNTPPIQNLQEAGQALFWDGRERILDKMVMQPIFNHVEMGMRSTAALTQKVAEKNYYKSLFKDAYGTEEVTFDLISDALGAFTSSIVSRGSKFDQFNGMFGIFNGPNSVLSEEENEGMVLFFEKYNCGSCHNLFSQKGYDIDISQPNSEGSEMVNIGLDANYNDNGRGALNGKAADDGKFKIPNLRNIALTGPYMHDGRFDNLEDVIEHYNTGIDSHPNLDARLKNADGSPKLMNITLEEKQKLITFLNALTDNMLISDPKFSDPFKKN